MADYSLGNIKASQFPPLSAKRLTWQVSSLETRRRWREQQQPLLVEARLPPERRSRYRQAGEIRDKVTRLAGKIRELQIAGGQVSSLGSIKLCTCPVPIAFPGLGHGRVQAMLAGRAAAGALAPPRPGSTTPGSCWRVHHTNTKQLPKSHWEPIFDYTSLLIFFFNSIFKDAAKNYEVCSNLK